MPTDSSHFRPVRWLAERPRRAFIVLFLMGFGMRVWWFQFFPDHWVAPNPDWETGAVSISLAQGGPFADPYLIPTGPTAHVPPLHVWGMSLLYRAMGVTRAAGYVRWLLALAAGAALYAALPWLGERLRVGREAGAVGGLAGAVLVPFPSVLEPLSALALALIMPLFLRRWTVGATTPGSFLFGLLLGVLFHLQPVLLFVALGGLGFELLWSRIPRRWLRSGVVVMGMALACLPWGVRNYRAFGEVMFVRSNFGLELYVGNHDGAHADIDVSSVRHSFQHPRTDLPEAERVRELGEAAYMREKREEALAWIGAHPWEFLRLTAWRTALFWLGPLHRPLEATKYLGLFTLALVGAWKVLPRLPLPHRATVLLPLATYPLVYYLLAYMPRYGEPVRWMLFLLAGAAVWGWLAPDRSRRAVRPLPGAPRELRSPGRGVPGAGHEWVREAGRRVEADAAPADGAGVRLSAVSVADVQGQSILNGRPPPSWARR